jgi:hypothetical protein
VNTPPDWIRVHGADPVVVTTLDVMGLVARLQQIGDPTVSPPLREHLVMRLVDSDLPRFRGYLPPAALDVLGEFAARRSRILGHWPDDP